MHHFLQAGLFLPVRILLADTSIRHSIAIWLISESRIGDSGMTV
jgi:hypothetical protein